MGLFGHLCTIGLALLQAPVHLWEAGRQEFLSLPSTSLDSPQHHQEVPIASDDSYGLPLGIYAPDLWRPVVEEGYQGTAGSKIYDDPFSTANKCNDKYNRRIWCNGKDITTDYEDIKNIPQGITRRYTLNITSSDMYCADGYCKSATLINGQYPGPLIRGNWGDTFEITVNNQLSNCNGTAFHWHGIRQWMNVWEDGVAGVTQCPIAPGKSQTYRWRAMQYGTSWYHSHFSLQYANGIAGPLIIDGPTSASYDIDKGPLMMTDWYHQDAFSQYHNEIAAIPPERFLDGADSVLINGRGNFTSYFKVIGGDGKAPSNKTMSFGCNANSKDDPNCLGPKYATRFISEIGPSTPGGAKRYKYRLINMSTVTHFAFWIDDHDFEVVATDFVPIKPVKMSYLYVAIGQRYDIIITAKNLSEVTKQPNYWMKMRLCNNYCLGDPCPTGQNCTYVECRQGILSYDTNHPGAPIRSPDYHSRPPPDVPDSGVHQLCTDPALADIKPIVQRNLRDAVGVYPSMGFKDPFEVDRRAGTQNFTEVFGDDDDDDHTHSEAAGVPTDHNNDDLVHTDGHYQKPGAPLHPLPPVIDPLDETKPHIWDFGSSHRTSANPNGSYISFMIDWANPGLLMADDGKPATNWNPRYYPVILNEPNQWKVFAIASNWTEDENHGQQSYLTVPGGAHPIHLHGHDFVVLHQSNPGDIFRYGTNYTMDLDNPVRRDVVMLPANGFVVIAFKTDNPGTWLMHCHIAWHASSGLALQWVERPADIPGLISPKVRAKFDQQCADWKVHEASQCDYAPGLRAEQDDSGI